MLRHSTINENLLLSLAGTEGTLSGDTAMAPEWQSQPQHPSEPSPMEPPVVQTQAPKSTSSLQTKGSDEISSDLVLPMSGLPPIPLHLVKSIK